MFSRILTSDVFALVLVVSSGVLLGLLYFKGQTTEAILGAIVLVVAVILMVVGRGRSDKVKH
ncbi:MAG: hypothetical protein QG663_896 [Thermodesulfobacteriota bacterium]|jgi:hypothetical protein|nr:hypothetical protein [Thermodesulfobacteriota bacterium]